MELEDNFVTGRLPDVRDTLNRSVGQYARNYNMKFGITTNPEQRMDWHEKSGLGWKKMVLKYKITSEAQIRQIEKELVEDNWERIENETGGGGGFLGTGSIYYLYILLK